MVKNYLNQGTFMFFETLIGFGDTFWYQLYVNQFLKQNFDLLAQEMRAIDAAISDNAELNVRKEVAKTKIQGQKEKMKKDFGYEAA